MAKSIFRSGLLAASFFSFCSTSTAIADSSVSQKLIERLQSSAGVGVRQFTPQGSETVDHLQPSGMSDLRAIVFFNFDTLTQTLANTSIQSLNSGGLTEALNQLSSALRVVPISKSSREITVRTNSAESTIHLSSASGKIADIDMNLQGSAMGFVGMAIREPETGEDSGFYCGGDDVDEEMCQPEPVDCSPSHPEICHAFDYNNVCDYPILIGVPGAGDGTGFLDWWDHLQYPGGAYPFGNYDRDQDVNEVAQELCDYIQAIKNINHCPNAKALVIGHSQGALVSMLAASICGDDMLVVAIDPAQWGWRKGEWPLLEWIYWFAKQFHPASKGIREGSDEHRRAIEALLGQECGYFPRTNPDGTIPDSDEPSTLPHTPFYPTNLPTQEWLDQIEECIRKLWEKLAEPELYKCPEGQICSKAVMSTIGGIASF